MSTTESSIQTQAPAKLNLTLAVLGKRADGYHDIESWVVKVALFDRLSFVPSPEYSLILGGDFVGVAADDSNLVTRATRCLAAESGRKPAVAVTLEKHIPIGAGLGGGSSDAEATLRGLNELWKLGYSTAQLQPVALKIGSDVPLFIEDASSVVIRGRGERVEPLASSWRGWFAIVCPGFPIPTAAVYGVLRADWPASTPRNQPWLNPSRPAADLQHELFNDLQPAAFSVEPRLAALHAALDELAGCRVHMTGSGSCLFALFDAREEAETWRNAALSRTGPPVRIEVVPTL